MNKLGLIAGNGTFPIAVAQAAQKRGIEVIAVAHLGETDQALEQFCPVTWIKVGEIEKMIASFKSHGIGEAAMAGGISRVRQQNSFAPDARAIRIIASAGRLSDDAILRGLAEELESENIKVIDPVFMLEGAIIGSGLLAGPEPQAGHLKDLELAFGVLRALGAFDVGQTVAARDGVIAAVEGVEGTDAALRRAAALCGQGMVVAKAAKPGQDLRFDRPAIGPNTIELLGELGAAMIGLEAGCAMVLERERTLELAERTGVTVYGFGGA